MREHVPVQPGERRSGRARRGGPGCRRPWLSTASGRGLAGPQPVEQLVGPAVVPVGGGAAAVGQRVAEDDDRPGRRARHPRRPPSRYQWSTADRAGQLGVGVVIPAPRYDVVRDPGCDVSRRPLLADGQVSVTVTLAAAATGKSTGRKPPARRPARPRLAAREGHRARVPGSIARTPARPPLGRARQMPCDAQFCAAERVAEPKPDALRAR